MSRRRIFPWAVVFAACLGLGSILLVLGPGRRPRLPALATYGNLPAAFDKALQGARARAVSGGSDDARALARLYQANRLFPEARACYRAIAAGPGGLSARDHYYLAAIAEDESDLAGAQDELRATLRAEPG
jgi:hypothetical protein